MDGWMDGWMDRWMNGWMYGWTKGRRKTKQTYICGVNVACWIISTITYGLKA